MLLVIYQYTFSYIMNFFNRLDEHAIIQYPVTTESAMKKIEDNNTLVFLVHKRATKSSIKNSVKKLYKVTVEKVNSLNTCVAIFICCTPQLIFAFCLTVPLSEYVSELFSLHTESKYLIRCAKLYLNSERLLSRFFILFYISSEFFKF